jgi:hypothetical protein
MSGDDVGHEADDDLPASTGKKLPRYPIVPADMDDSRVVFLRRVAPVTESRF